MIKIATCGWCRRTELTNSKESGLETHYKPNTRTRCDGPATSSYASKITAKYIRDPKKAA